MPESMRSARRILLQALAARGLSMDMLDSSQDSAISVEQQRQVLHYLGTIAEFFSTISADTPGLSAHDWMAYMVASCQPTRHAAEANTTATADAADVVRAIEDIFPVSTVLTLTHNHSAN